jgi:tetratricopeptide (TPR) repeat protein
MLIMSLNPLIFCLLLQQAAPSGAGAATPASRAQAYHHYSLAQQARLDGDPATALRELEQARRLDPTSGQIRADLALVLRQLGRGPEALAEALEAVKLAPDDAELHLIAAQLYQLSGDGMPPAELQARVAEHLEHAVRLRPTDARSLLVLAELYGRLEKHEDAVRIWRSYLKLEEANADGWFELGRHLLALNKSDDAAAAFRQALAVEPGSVRAYQELGDIYSRAEQHEQAVLSYRKGIEIDGRNLRLRLSLGEALYRARRLDEVLPEAEAALANDPKNRFALELKGRTLRDLKRYDEAMAAADLALAGDPRDVKIAYLKVTILEARRDWPGAEAALAALLARDRRGEPSSETSTNDRVFLVHLGFAQQQQERHADAAESFRRAIAVSTAPDPALYGYRISALVAARDLGKALDEVRDARKRHPEDMDLALQEAEVRRRRGEREVALRVADEMAARAKTPDELAAVAELEQRAHRYDKAEALLKKALAAEPRDLRLLFQMGAVLERLKRHAEAEAMFREALEVDPESAPVLNYLGYMNADRGIELPASLKMIEKALAIDPGNAAYLDSLGWAMFRMGRLEEAETHVRAAIAKQGANPDVVVLDHLADVLHRRGDAPEAIRTWNLALQGEDESGELDRVAVERKIREAQARLDAQAQKD